MQIRGQTYVSIIEAFECRLTHWRPHEKRMQKLGVEQALIDQQKACIERWIDKLRGEGCT